MVKILFGDEFVEQNTVLYGCPTPTRRWSWTRRCQGRSRSTRRNNQAVACTPWMITGAMSPCTEAGTLAQLLAEALATCALTQLIRPWYTPCLMGSFATPMSMQSGAPTFGMPEAAKTVLAAGQLARQAGCAVSHRRQPDFVQDCQTAQAQQEGSMSVDHGRARRRQLHQSCDRLARRRICAPVTKKPFIDADLCGKLIAFCQGTGSVG